MKALPLKQAQQFMVYHFFISFVGNLQSVIQFPHEDIIGTPPCAMQASKDFILAVMRERFNSASEIGLQPAKRIATKTSIENKSLWFIILTSQLIYNHCLARISAYRFLFRLFNPY
jgi:hypothetical protein